jgi:ubiquinone/menaquinone biosynthesis C-methylase UbiE
VPAPTLIALAAGVLQIGDAPDRILEVGCGTGDGVFFLAREFPAARVRGVDPSRDAIREAVSRAGLDPEGRVAFKQGDARSLPYPDDLFDLVVQRDGRLRAGEIARVLRPGGELLLVGRQRLADWRLRGRGFEALRAGEAGGERFLLARLARGEGERE